MSNGATIDSIEKILTGEQELPERVSNALLLAAIRANYQNVSCLGDDINKLKETQSRHGTEIEGLKKRSDRWDMLNTLAVTLGSALGYWSGQK